MNTFCGIAQKRADGGSKEKMSVEESQSYCLTNLPSDVLVIILEYLPLFDLANIRLVGTGVTRLFTRLHHLALARFALCCNRLLTINATCTCGLTRHWDCNGSQYSTGPSSKGLWPRPSLLCSLSLTLSLWNV